MTEDMTSNATARRRVETFTRRKDPKREIREAAERLWSQRGFHATGIQDLCDEVSMGRGALYYHIKSKEDLLLDISLFYLERLIEDGQNILKEKASHTELLYKLSHNLMRNIAQHRDGWTVFFAEIRSLQGERRDQVMARRDVYENIWLSVLDKGTAAGEFQPTSRLLVKGVLGMHNYSYLWLQPDGPVSPEEVGTIFMDTILNGIQSKQNL